MYEEIDEAHRIITRRVYNATTKYGYDCRGGYKPRDGYLYMRDYHKRKYLLDSVETFARMLCNVLEDEGIPAYYDRDKVLRIPPNCRDYYWWPDMIHPHLRVPISGIGDVVLMCAINSDPPSYYVHRDPKFRIPIDARGDYSRGHYYTTKKMVDTLKLMIGYMGRYLQCKECHYSDEYGEYCGMGVQILPDTCTQGPAPTNN